MNFNHFLFATKHICTAIPSSNCKCAQRDARLRSQSLTKVKGFNDSICKKEKKRIFNVKTFSLLVYSTEERLEERSDDFVYLSINRSVVRSFVSSLRSLLILGAFHCKLSVIFFSVPLTLFLPFTPPKDETRNSAIK